MDDAVDIAPGHDSRDVPAVGRGVERIRSSDGGVDVAVAENLVAAPIPGTAVIANIPSGLDHALDDRQPS